jgi:hypothetical protein
MENARAPIIGVLEKREGQAKVGTNITATANYGIARFENKGDNQGVFRVSATGSTTPPSSPFQISVKDRSFTFDRVTINHPDADVVYDTGWCSPAQTGTKTLIAGLTNGQFNNPTFAFIDDNKYASSKTPNNNFKTQSYENFNFGLPTDFCPILTGLIVEMKGKADNQSLYGYSLVYSQSLSPAVNEYNIQGGSWGGYLYTNAADQTFQNGTSTSVPSFNTSTGTSPLSSQDLKESDFYVVAVAEAGGLSNDRIWDLNHIQAKVFYKKTFPLIINVSDFVSVSDTPLSSRLFAGTILIYPTKREGITNIFSLSQNNTWEIIPDIDAQNLLGGQADFSTIEGKMAIVDGADLNRLLLSDGKTVLTSADPGDLFNSPVANKVTFYKNRIYLANFTRNGIRFPTTVLRSSFPLGIVALTNSDVTASGAATVIPVTDTKYFYADSGMNSYDVYRGNTKITTLTVTGFSELDITVSSLSADLKSSDEIWVAGTYNGEKQYRWQANPSSLGQNVKQYETMKLSGGDEDPITLFETVGNILMVGNKNTLMTWNDYNFENIDMRVGSVSQNGYIKFIGSLYFLHYTGVYSTTGAAPTLISRKIDRYIHGATKAGLEASCAGYKGLSVFFTIGDVTLYRKDGSFWKVLPDVCIEYHVGNQDWYIHTNVPASEFETFMDTAGKEHLLMQHEGTGKYIKEFLTGSTDDGAEIFFQVDTQILHLNQEFEYFINPNALILDVDRGSGMKCFISPDEDQDFFEIQGTVSKGISTLKMNSESDVKVKPVLGRHVRLSFRDGSKQLCRLIQCSLLWMPTMIDFTE